MATPLDNDLGIPCLSFIAGGTIAINRAVVLDSTVNQVVAGSAIAGNCIGIAKKAAASGDQVPVQVAGVSKVTTSAAVALGAEVMVTASGSGKVSTSAGATAQSIGVAVSASGADAEEIGVLLAVPAVKRPPNS